MQKIKLENEKGITLLILVVTIVVLILISVPIVVNTTELSELQDYTDFKADIDKLRESVETTYTDTALDITQIGPKYTGSLDFLNGSQNGKTVKNPNDNVNYYVINLRELNSHIGAQIDLINGEGNKLNNFVAGVSSTYNGTDAYIINEQSRTIYYTDGVEYKGEKYYRLPEDFTEQSSLYAVQYDVNGGTNAPNMQTVPTTGSEKIQVGAAPTRAGYTFKGWKDSKTGTIYQPNAQYTVTGNVTFIAEWQKN